VFLTGDAVAAAVLDYALALGELRRFGTVDLPVRREDGIEGRARLVLTPVSQISTESVATALPEVHDPELVAHLEAAAERLRDPFAGPIPAVSGDGRLAPEP
jgi:hypothetical protein